ncbi:MAG: hypothetical protein V5A62_05550 [Haloarculaceae archaeon]
MQVRNGFVDRPTAGDPPPMREVIETGVGNAIVPRGRSAEETRRTVRAARYDYEGQPGDRGVCDRRANRWFAFVGHRAPTHSLGHGEDVTYPDVATETLREAGLDAGVPVGRVASDVPDAGAGSKRGFDLSLVGYELDTVRAVFGGWVDAFGGNGA